MKYFYLTLLFFLSSITIAQNCNCQKPDFQAAYDSASIIFVGKVTEFTTNWMSGGMKVSFMATQKWKDDGENFIVVNSPFTQNCGDNFEVGKEYLVYAKKKHITLKTSACYRTAPIENAQEDLKMLGKSSPKSASNAKLFILGMSLWVIGSSVFILFVILRRRKSVGK